MLKNLTIRKKIMVILFLTYVCSICLATGAGYYILKEDTTRESMEKTKIFAAVMSSSRDYLVDEIRPQVKKLLPNTWFPEGTVGTLLLSNVAQRVQEKYPEYIYKVASTSPHNSKNKADRFEAEVIDQFDTGMINEWQGYVEKNGKPYYAIASPMKAGEKCIWCHDTPDRAPKGLVKTYGTESGYDYVAGDVIGVKFVYVPTAVANLQAQKKLGFFAGGISVFFLLALFLIDRIIISSVVKPIEGIVSVADEISRGKMDRDFEVDSKDEIQSLAKSFSRMKTSLLKAMDILKK